MRRRREFFVVWILLLPLLSWTLSNGGVSACLRSNGVASCPGASAVAMCGTHTNAKGVCASSCPMVSAVVLGLPVSSAPVMPLAHPPQGVPSMLVFGSAPVTAAKPATGVPAPIFHPPAV